MYKRSVCDEHRISLCNDYLGTINVNLHIIILFKVYLDYFFIFFG